MKLELRSVRIKNCGPIDDIKVDFFDASVKTLPVCVIGGANGSGKTTILELIAILGKYVAEEFQYEKDEKTVLGKAKYVRVDFVVDEGVFSVDLGGLSDNHRRIQYFLNDNEVGGADFVRRLNEGIRITKNLRPGQSKLSFHLPILSLPSIIYLPHNRRLEPVTSDQIQKEPDRYEFVQRITTVKKFRGSLTSYLIWLEYSDTDRFHKMQTFLNNLNFEGKTFQVNRQALDVLVKTEKGQVHRLHELSSGEQNLLIILIELYRKLLPGSIVLIDEIENSLHPAYQHRLAQGLLALQKEIPYQLIVTTHAPAFVEIFGEENTRLLTPF